MFSGGMSLEIKFELAIIKKPIETEFQSAFNSMIGLMLHQLISHEKGFAKSCLISHKPWRETENWSY